ncbi:MAG: S-layer homology domain-containing protein [Oscillospiraceae bacterium]|jgi:hypothetical protein|nr:S-layer homology domain-containing protein [Oscillospiraceae bacterium]
MRRVTALLLGAAFLFAAEFPAAAAVSAPFDDCGGHWAESEIAWASEHGIIGSGGSFEPNRAVTRAEFAALLGSYCLIFRFGLGSRPAERAFRDVDPESPYAPYIYWAAAYGIAEGVGGGRFAPDAPITRQDAAVMLERLFHNAMFLYLIDAEAPPPDYADRGAIPGYAVPAVRDLYRAGIMVGKGAVFDPRGLVTRAETAVLVCRADAFIRAARGE